MSLVKVRWKCSLLGEIHIMKGLFPMDTIVNTQVWLTEKFGKYDWFHSVGQDDFNTPVLYTKYLNLEVLNLTSAPERNFKVHYATSMTVSSNDYTTTESMSGVQLLEADSDSDFESEVDLHEELWGLQRICGRDNLIDIFYEVHDGNNAVTSLSAEFPEVRAAMDVLYNNVGFDILFEELDSEEE